MLWKGFSTIESKCIECNRKANIKSAYGQLMCYECLVHFQNEQELAIRQENAEDQDTAI